MKHMAYTLVFLGLLLEASVAAGVIAEHSGIFSEEIAYHRNFETFDGDEVNASNRRAEGRSNYAYHAESSYGDDVPLSIIPLVGGSWYAGRWNDHITNSYNLGVALEIPINHIFAGEAELGYGNYSIGYTSTGIPWKHDYNLFTLGGTLKAYALTGRFRPYAGLGLLANIYDGMTRGPRFQYMPRYSEWIGSAQLMLGSDFEVAEGVALGARGSWVIPVFNRPETRDNGVVALPYFEEAAAMNTSYYRLMATVKVAL